MIKGCGIKIGSWIWSANREREIIEVGIGIGKEVMLVVVAVAVEVVVEDITSTMRDIVVVMGMGGRLMIGGDDEFVLPFCVFFIIAPILHISLF